MELLEISSEDITKLDDTQLRTLIGMLCEAEYRSLGLSTNCIIWGGDQDAPDGGLDVVIRGSSVLPRNSFIPRSVVGIQVKKPDMPSSKIRKEMRFGNNGLRSSIKALIKEKGAYIIVSTKKALTDSMYCERIEAMKEAIQNEEHCEDFFVDFYDANRVSTWVSNHPSLILWVRNKVHRPLKGWRPYENWSYPSCDTEDEYIGFDEVVLTDNTITSLDGSIDNGIQKLRATLSKPGAVVRLVGVSGVGKTRLAQALFDERIGTNALNYLQVYYTDLADSPEPDPIHFAEQLNACKARAVLIIDNCPSELHNRLTQFCINTLISLISIEYDIQDDLPNETDVFRLDPVNEDVIETLIKKRFSLVSSVDVQQIARFSGGNAKIAIALAHTVTKSGSLSGLRDEDLFIRLFHQRQNKNEQLLLFAQIFSLVYSFDGVDLDSNKSELGFLASIINKTGLALYQEIITLKDRGLLQCRGQWRAILPPAIANRLAKKALEALPKDYIVKHFMQNGSERLIQSFSRRLSYLHDCNEAHLIVEDLLSSNGLLGKKAGSYNELEMHVFKNIAPVLPQLTLVFIENLARENETIVLSQHHSYFEFVKILRLLAYEAQLFDRCVQVLIHFALIEKVENGDNSNSSRATLRSLFFLYLSGSHASIEQRAGVINKLICSDEHQENELGLFLLEAALESEHFSSYYEFNFGARTRDYGLHPKTQQDIVHWYTTFVDLITGLVLSDKRIATQARSIFAKKLPGLWLKVRMVKFLEESILKIHNHTVGQWSDGWIALHRILKNKKDLSEQDLLETTLKLEKKIRPDSLVDLSCSLLLLKSYQYMDMTNKYSKDDDINGRLQETNELIESIAQKVAQDQSSLDMLLPKLCSMPHTRQEFFGVGLARGCNDKLLLWRKLINQFDITPIAERNLSVLCGFLSGCSKEEPLIYNKVMDDAVDNRIIGEYFPILQATSGIDKKALGRLHKSLSLQTTKVDAFIRLAYGEIPKSISDDDLANLLNELLLKEGGDRVVVEIISMRFHDEKKDPAIYSKHLIAVTRRTLASFNFNRAGKQSGFRDLDYSFSRVIETALLTEDSQQYALEVCQNLKKAIINGWVRSYDYPYIINSLARSQPEIFLNIFFNGSKLDDNHHGLRLLNDIDGNCSVLDLIPVDVLICWCDLDSKSRYPLIASLVSLFIENNETVRLCLSSLFYAILNNAPDLKSVLSEFSKSIWPMSYTDSLADALEVRSKLLEGLLCHERKEISDWAKEQVAILREHTLKNRDKEARQKKIRNERFE
ncbi:hypothetical protein [Legionella worsleiensis]|uniref:hypothetical protein n=1 Tax=Legionella worsleiensis TaxID=45076 RepID=UPI000DFA7081|nr:hypothetical protein [Legionella worsleiensis]STY50004.1 Uncharacterised protein [Legionella worsleiensis]